MTITAATRAGSAGQAVTAADSVSSAAAGPASEVPEQPVGPRAGQGKRRTFTAEYKRAIVAEYEAAEHGSKGAVLRRERLFDSHIQEWRAASAAGTLETPERGRPRRSPEQARIAELEKQVARLEAETARKDEVIADRDAALEVLGKGVAFLEAISANRRR